MNEEEEYRFLSNPVLVENGILLFRQNPRRAKSLAGSIFFSLNEIPVGVPFWTQNGSPVSRVREDEVYVSDRPPIIVDLGIRSKFSQIREKILSGALPVSRTDAIQVAAFLLKIDYGDFKPHLLRMPDKPLDVKKFLPISFQEDKTIVQQVMSSWKQLSTGTLDIIAAVNQFLFFCRLLKFYGFDVFRVKAPDPSSATELVDRILGLSETNAMLSTPDCMVTEWNFKYNMIFSMRSVTIAEHDTRMLILNCRGYSDKELPLAYPDPEVIIRAFKERVESAIMLKEERMGLRQEAEIAEALTFFANPLASTEAYLASYEPYGIHMQKVVKKDDFIRRMRRKMGETPLDFLARCSEPVRKRLVAATKVVLGLAVDPPPRGQMYPTSRGREGSLAAWAIIDGTIDYYDAEPHAQALINRVLDRVITQDLASSLIQAAWRGYVVRRNLLRALQKKQEANGPAWMDHGSNAETSDEGEDCWRAINGRDASGAADEDEEFVASRWMRERKKPQSGESDEDSNVAGEAEPEASVGVVEAGEDELLQRLPGVIAELRERIRALEAETSDKTVARRREMLRLLAKLRAAGRNDFSTDAEVDVDNEDRAARLARLFAEADEFQYNPEFDEVDDLDLEFVPAALREEIERQRAVRAAARAQQRTAAAAAAAEDWGRGASSRRARVVSSRL